MKQPKRYLVTSALPYANGPLHIGHLAGAYLSADVFVRYLRLMGRDVVWVCGSDEHGAAITIRAKKEGITPQEIIDKYDASFRETFAGIGCDFDIFHRTSAPLHHETSQDFFKNLYEKGEFLEQETEQYYDEKAQQFLADRYIIGTCPKCGHAEAYGDQCEKCGSTLSPIELKSPIRSVLSDATPVLKKTSHWYLPLDKYAGWLTDYIEKGTLDGADHHDVSAWKNHVMGQCKSWLEQGLQPRAMTRDLEWGVDVPESVPHHKGKKLYVWMDAPIGYISATKQWAIDQGQPEAWKAYWQDPDTHLVHFIGKDNIVFHCIIFPGILKAHGGYNLPVNVPANQFMNLEGRKLSTSKNWAVWVHEYLQEFEGKADVLRYNMIKNMPELQDSEFTWKRFQESNNNELVGNLANFINRVLVLTHKFYEGKTPDFDSNLPIVSSSGATEMATYDQELKKIGDKMAEIGQFIEKYEFRNALQGLMEMSSMGNQLLQFNEPWKAVKTAPEATAVTMNLGLQIVAALSVAMRPFLPFTADALRDMLNLAALTDKGEWHEVQTALLAGTSIVPTGHGIQPAGHLFTRIPDEVIQAQIDKLVATDAANAAAETPQTPQYQPVKEIIGIDDFNKIDIRTGTITAAERIPKADKLLKLTIDLGFETRTILSGIAEHFAPEAVIGQQVTVLVNLAPRKMRGFESNGMILMAEDGAGKLGFVTAPAGWPNGFTVK